MWKVYRPALGSDLSKQKNLKYDASGFTSHALDPDCLNYLRLLG